MKNITKYVGFLVITAILLVNCFLLNKQFEQNKRIEGDILRIESEIKNVTRYINVNQSYEAQKPIQIPKQKEIMTPLDLADYLGIDMDIVYAMAENKDSKIPYINIDGEYKFSKAAIDEWMKTTKEITTGK